MSALSEDDPTTRLLREQVEFYEADAMSYDRWLASLADDNNSTAAAVTARAQVRRLARWFESQAPLGDVLEIAAGTGGVSQLLAPHAARLVLVDSSPTSLAIAAEKLAGSPSYAASVCVDVFEWSPPRRFDTVVFAAWLHHVPDPAFNEFWGIVDVVTVPEGQVMFDYALDTPNAEVAAPPPTPSIGFAVSHDPAKGISVRDLDGQRWTVAHQTWKPETLTERLRSIGWELAASGPADDAFQWATASRLP